MKKLLQLLFFLGLAGSMVGFNLWYHPLSPPPVPFAYVAKQNLTVEVKTIGELEAARSMTIASSIKGDQGKIIDLIADGLYVQPGEVLVRLDTTPFEEKIEKLQGEVKEQEGYITTLEQTVEWELLQAEHKNRMAQLELEAAQLELDRIKYGEGPQEIARLKAAVQKSWLKFDELNAYSNDLANLEKEGFLNPAEVKQAQKKLMEEQEAYEIAKQQYDTYVQHVYPMQVKKGETHVKRAQVHQEEAIKGGAYTIAKAKALLDQAQHTLADSLSQLREAQRELSFTHIVAPTQGMVVLREEYRASQKRKPRVGDILVKNQPLIDLPDLSSMLIKTRVREVDLFKVAVGKKAQVAIDAYPQLTFTGTVTAIGVLALSDLGRSSEEKYFEVRIALDGSDPRLRPGMTARVSILAQEAPNALTIPLYSVFNDQNAHYCYILDPQHRYEKRLISLGISNEQWVEVKEGLQEGESICLLHPFH